MHYRSMTGWSPLRRYWTVNLAGLAVWIAAAVFAVWAPGDRFPGLIIFGLVALGILIQNIAIFAGMCLVCGTPMSHSFNGLLFWWPNDYCGRCGSSLKRASGRSGPSA